MFQKISSANYLIHPKYQMVLIYPFLAYHDHKLRGVLYHAIDPGANPL